MHSSKMTKSASNILLSYSIVRDYFVHDRFPTSDHSCSTFIHAEKKIGILTPTRPLLKIEPNSIVNCEAAVKQNISCSHSFDPRSRGSTVPRKGIAGTNPKRCISRIATSHEALYNIGAELRLR